MSLETLPSTVESGIAYSVVVPCYYSERTLADLLEHLDRVFRSAGLTYEVIFVDDGSMDGTWKTIVSLCDASGGRVRGVRLARNFGQHNATLCGFRFARGEFAVTIDDDLQTPPSEILKLRERQKEGNFDLVYGVYAEKKHGSLRNLGSRGVQRILSYAFESKVKASSFRLLRRSLYEKLTKFSQSSLYLDGLVSWHTRSVTSVVVEHRERVSGESGYRIWGLVRMASRLVFDYTTLPLRAVVFLGLLMSGFSFLAGSFFVAKKLFFGAPLGFTSVIASIFLSTGLILLCIGVIGEYLRRLLAMATQRPQTSIAEVI